MNIQIRWQAPVLSSYCLYAQDKRQPIKCWFDVSAGILNIDYSLERALTLQLRQYDSLELVYQKTITLQRELKKFRKTRRNPWRFY